MTRPNSSRAIRAQRKAKEEMRGGIFFSDEAVKWHTDVLLDNLKDDAQLTLPNGTQADPRQARVLPSNEQEM